jgi:hypothetical protein
VVEFGFDVESGLWRHLRIRIDKDNANYISTVASNLRCLEDSIDEDELCLRLGSGLSGPGAAASENEKNERRMPPVPHRRHPGLQNLQKAITWAESQCPRQR